MNPNRRELVLGAGSLIGLTLAPLESLRAQEAVPPWQDVLAKIVGGAKPIEGKLVLEMPEIAESGNTVPFTATVESPMTEQDHVKAIHIISTANPQANVAVFRFTPLSGKAAVSSRMRLARTQEVISVAELSDGKILLSKRNVKVTIGGCGG